MCARRVLISPMPRSTAMVLAAAFRSVRAQFGTHLPAGRCLGIIADEFTATYEATLPKARTPSMKARERDNCLCCVPGCSRPAANAHHKRFRSQGGGNELFNLIGMCLFHHLRCLHKGYLSVFGEPGALLWFYGRPKLGPAVAMDST